MATHTISGIIHKTAYGFTIGGTQGSDDSPQSNGGALPSSWVTGGGSAYVRKFAVLRSNTLKIGGVSHVMRGIGSVVDTMFISIFSPELTDLTSLTKLEIAHYTDLSWDVRNVSPALPESPRQFVYVAPIGDSTDIVRVYAPSGSVDAEYLLSFKDGDTIYLNGEPYVLRRDSAGGARRVNMYVRNLVDPGDTLYLGSSILKWTEKVEANVEAGPSSPNQFRQLPPLGGVDDITLSISYAGTTITQALGTPSVNINPNLQWGDRLGLKIPNAWMQGRIDAWIDRFRFSGTRTPSSRSGEIAIAIASSTTRGSPTNSGQNLDSAVRAGLVLTLSAPAHADVVINGIVPDDPSEPHLWQASNFADVITFYNNVKSAGSGQSENTLQLYAPGGSAARTLLTNLRAGSNIVIDGTTYTPTAAPTAEPSKEWVNIVDSSFPTFGDTLTVGLNTNRWNTKIADISQPNSPGQWNIADVPPGGVDDTLSVYAPEGSATEDFLRDLGKGELYIALNQDDSGSGIASGPTLTDAALQDITISMSSGSNSFETTGLGSINTEPYQWQISDADKEDLAISFAALNDYDMARC